VLDESTIREHFRRAGYNVSRTARNLDIDYDVAKEILDPEIPPVKGPTEPRPADIKQLGKIGLRRFVIAVKATTDREWPEEFSGSIHMARLRYDAGTHEMYQETRDGWNILYSQPRRKAVPSRPYFTKRDIF
jgi:hypothetical protein